MNKKSKILLFNNIFNSSGHSGQGLSLATLYLASGLKKAGFTVIFSPTTNKEELRIILKENPDINFIGISLCEALFEKTKDLIVFLRKKTKAYIGVGGAMPTLTPNHTLAHLPEINFLIRGNGEEVFKKLVQILNGRNTDSSLTPKIKNQLAELQGFAFKKGKLLISSNLNQINCLKDTADFIDFSFFKKADLNDGLFLFASSGCFNNCIFCTSPSKGKFLAVSFKNLKKILGKYYLHLKKEFGKTIPSSAFRIAFLDDDFLADPQRAIKLFNFLKKTPFKINFIQTGINAFYERKKDKYTNEINKNLLNALSQNLFDPEKEINIYIGLENLSNDELKRLNKGYDSSKAEKIIKNLAAKKIRVAYHFIASNQLTTLDNLFENLLKFSIFQIRFGDYFKILTPIIPYLVSLYPSPSYKIIAVNHRKKFLNIRKILSTKTDPASNYPLIENDIPINKEVKEFIPILPNLFLAEKNYLKILDQALLNLFILKEKMPQNEKINQVIEKYKNYHQIVFKETGFKMKNDRHNIQLMITRRCQLRCQYCPVIKKNADMKEKTLYQAIDLLFTSPRTELRLDFTGGDPLLRFDLVKKGVEYAKKKSQKTGKKISFYLVSNLIALNEKMAEFLNREKFFLELSLDGKEKFHNLYKIGANPKINPYQLTTASLEKIISRKTKNCGVMVVAPQNAGYLSQNFNHLLKLGIREISINYALGLNWPKKKIKKFLSQLDLIKNRFSLFLTKKIIKLSNAESRLEPAILNDEIMIDTDGGVYLLTDWFFEKKARNGIRTLGKLKEFRNLNDIFISNFQTLYRLLQIYPQPKIRKTIFNNIEIGNTIKKYFKYAC
jgi:radical SAM superfamily enzyme YgiQ (UPF0313 family)